MISQILDTAKLSPNFRITIPTETRNILKVLPGDKIVYFLENDEIILRKA